MEKGIEITSTIRNKPTQLSLKGKIVDANGKTANDILTKIKELQRKGSLITYSGRNSMTNLQIQSFNTSHPYTNAGGADFDMELKEVRIAKSAYNKNAAKENQEDKKTNPDLSVGAIVVFKGGPVYVSSDATKPAAKRGRSTCKITIINERSWSKHSYHLISTDGGRVYGWVDKENIEGVPSNTTAAITNGGTQQVKEAESTTTTTTKKANSTKDTFYYVVKKGDTVERLANTTFKEYGMTAKEIMNANPQAFSVKGRITSLIVGSTLKITKKTAANTTKSTYDSGTIGVGRNKTLSASRRGTIGVGRKK